jgi:predicted PurR-regulated permease PerM
MPADRTLTPDGVLGSRDRRSRRHPVNAFVVLSLALAVAAMGCVVVAAVILGRQLRQLSAALQRTSEQVTALSAELDDELAVLTLESDGLQRRLSNGHGPGGGRYTPGKDRPIPAGG